ncbi:hypothetical protein C7457_0775 [Thermovibrio guaymasensis]|uniref:Uncharacterized protein n=1 Tax=Thermovibrio guaymasensis TaxID=240167 RepID=A0A420W980_9BACT|nr:hypothetical protein [Thermovibrio guaymasensis]RKQ63891.1 hypothetical protein C7457_0775 [Thermovibrio guaymasensis]
MSENEVLGIFVTIVAILLPLSFAVLAWKHTLSGKKGKGNSG